MRQHPASRYKFMFSRETETGEFVIHVISETIILIIMTEMIIVLIMDRFLGNVQKISIYCLGGE